MKRLSLLIALTLCAAVNSARAVAPGPEWKLLLTMGDQLFPSYVVATATMPAGNTAEQNPYFLGDRRGLWGISLANPAANTRIRLEVRIDQLYAAGTYNGVLPEHHKIYEVFPKIQYRYDLLVKNRQLIPANVVFKLYLNDKYIGQGVKTIQVHSINDCPGFYTDTRSQTHNITWMFAAYVNEDHPWIDQLLREALNTKVVNSFGGYQRPPAEVYKQVFAVWDAFQRKGFRYSSIIVTPTTGTQIRVVSQTVRFLDQAVTTSQANCVDGSVLFASVLRKIGIDPFLIEIPHHMFLGFYLDKQHRQPSYLETTMMGLTDLSQYPEEDAVARTVSSNLGQATKNQASYKAFIKAVQVGTDKFKKNKESIEKHENPRSQIIDIAQARKMGVLPIAR